MRRSELGRGGRGTQEETREEMHLPPLLQRTAVVIKRRIFSSETTFLQTDFYLCYMLLGLKELH